MRSYPPEGITPDKRDDPDEGIFQDRTDWTLIVSTSEVTGVS